MSTTPPAVFLRQPTLQPALSDTHQVLMRRGRVVLVVMAVVVVAAPAVVATVVWIGRRGVAASVITTTAGVAGP